MASPTWWTWVWVNSGSWWWTEAWRAAIHGVSKSLTQLSDWTELNWRWMMSKKIFLGAFWTLVDFLWRSVHSDALTISKLGYLSVYYWVERGFYILGPPQLAPSRPRIVGSQNLAVRRKARQVPLFRKRPLSRRSEEARPPLAVHCGGCSSVPSKGLPEDWG